MMTNVTANRIGVLLVNLGTPEATDYWSVRRYLSEFLSDPRVIEINPLWWQPLLQGVILTSRPFHTGAAYRRIWCGDSDESPLRRYTRMQAAALTSKWGAERGVLVAWAMRYGAPSIVQRLEHLAAEGCDRILVVPLYPQYSASTTATVNDAAFQALTHLRHQPAIRTAPSFPDHPLYIGGVASRIRETLRRLDWEPDLLVGSFHGLPQRYVTAGDPYPAECERTMIALRQYMGLSAQRFPMTFQSRFGREPWLMPYTAEYVAALPAQGVKRIAVVAPGFIADCIETLDELGCELRESFLAHGGERFCLIPCLNDSPGAVRLLDALIVEELAGWMPRERDWRLSTPGVETRSDGSEPPSPNGEPCATSLI
jgi:protoporphyrin/coproporphyrin ferrochelatase